MEWHDGYHYADAMWAPNGRKMAVQNAVKAIHDTHLEFDAIVFAGASGALFAVSLADALGKPLCCMRISVRFSTRAPDVVGACRRSKYLMVDDCIDRGETYSAILKSLTGYNERAQIVAVFLTGEFFSRTRELVKCPVYHTPPNKTGWSFHHQPTV